MTRKPSQTPRHATTPPPPGAGGAARRGRPPKSDAGALSPRERLLKAAGELFPVRGIAAVGIDELVAHAEVARMSLYQHFSGKEGLIAEYLRAQHRGWMAFMADGVERARRGGPRAKLLGVFHRLGEWHMSERYAGCPFARALGELGDSSEQVRGAMDEHADAVQAWMAGLCRDAALRSPDETAAKLIVLLNGANLTAAADANGRAQAARLARAVAEVVIREAE